MIRFICRQLAFDTFYYMCVCRRGGRGYWKAVISEAIEGLGWKNTLIKKNIPFLLLLRNVSYHYCQSPKFSSLKG